MCFSATASFSAGIGLILCGAFALMRAKQDKLKMIAAVPLIFGLQQITEGFVWLSFINPDFESIRMIAAYAFLAVAGIVWPIWVPVALMRYEQTGKYYLSSLFAGILYALGFIAYVVLYPIEVTAPCNIVYTLNATPWLNGLGMAFYAIATLLPFVFTRNKSLKFIGAIAAASYVIAYIFYLEAFASVWCFFAAIISILIYGFVANESLKSSAVAKAMADRSGRGK